jgi:tetratricopeptide (TPR) repeat protein
VRKRSATPLDETCAAVFCGNSRRRFFVFDFALWRRCRAFSTDPKESGSLFSLTTLADIKTKLIHRGKTAEAVKIAVFATQEFPESPSAWYHLGDACLRNGDRERARAAVERSLLLKPHDSLAIALLTSLEGATHRPHSECELRDSEVSTRLE